MTLAFDVETPCAKEQPCGFEIGRVLQNCFNTDFEFLRFEIIRDSIGRKKNAEIIANVANDVFKQDDMSHLIMFDDVLKQDRVINRPDVLVNDGVRQGEMVDS